MEKVLVIAEAGVNHNGEVELAKKLIREAKKAGADIVKFQTSNLDALVSKFAEMCEYQKQNLGYEKSQKEMLRKIVLPFDAFYEIAACCKEEGIKFLSTPFDLLSIDFLEELGCDMWKIPSGEITNRPYLIKIANTHKPIILSTGMSTIEEVRACYDLLQEYGAGEITLLHCTTQYPTEYEDVNLRAMLTLQKEFGCKVGYSDHSRGIEVPVAAVGMGATVIEKHFTLDKTMEGPDHKASLEPSELTEMISMIRNIEKALGDGIKQPKEIEKANIGIVRKSIIAKTDIKRGDIFTEDNITTKRPGSGISPMRWNEVIGQPAKRDFAEDELIEI